MENKRTILEYLDSLNGNSKSKKKETPKVSNKVSKSDTSKCVDISEINKVFDTFTMDIKRLNRHLKEVSNYSSIRYVEGEIHALEYSRNIITTIIEKHLK